MDLWEYQPKKAGKKPDAAPSAETGEPEELSGVVENIVYHSEESGYTVCAVKIPGREDAVTVVGNCAAIWIGESLKASGRWVRHRQHGLQFQTDSILCVAPTSARGLERYLASGMIRGIGKVMAARLVEHFGQDTLKVIEKDSARLEEVEGVGASRRKMIKESWIEQKSVRDIMIFLQSHGVGVAHSARIYRQYGNQAIAMITDDPYRLCRDIWGIGFKTADAVAMSLGVPRESVERARAGLVHVLQTMMDEGHCYCGVPELILQSQVLLEIAPEILTEALSFEVKSARLVKDGERIYLNELYEAETAVAAKIRRLLDTPPGYRPIDTFKAVPWAEEQMKVTFAAMQAEALRMTLAEKVSIITGGPGVGKTTIIRALVDVYKRRGLRVLLAAPTGRAAKRMEEATAHKASTIHRLLKYMPATREFEFNEAQPLEGDVVILDEVSMVDIQLMHDFLRAMPDTASLVLVGDVDQLPSVGPGNVLRDLIASGMVPFRKLETIFRQETGGWIVRNAHHVNHGESIEFPPQDEPSDFYFLECDDPEKMIERTLELLTQRIPKRFGFNPMTDIQVLTPMRRNQLGSENLNALLQAALNPAGPEVSRFGRQYRQGDRVMQVRNNYDKETYNGDVGIIQSVDAAAQSLTVVYEDRPVKYEFAELDELLHAFACSIHKSQGSEYQAVIILLATQHFKLLQRNLLYTAITRGKKLVCLVGSRKAVHIAIRNNQIRMRRTGLSRRLGGRDEEIVMEEGS